MASEQDSVSALFPAWGQAGAGLSAGQSAPGWGSSVPFLLHVQSGQEGLQGGGCPSRAPSLGGAC